MRPVAFDRSPVSVPVTPSRASSSLLLSRIRSRLVGRERLLAVTLVLTLAVGIRCAGLGAYGFSEDEVNKLRAVERYRQLDFTPNAEHPMLMKLAVGASLGLAHGWNALAPEGAGLSDEAALRLPNALAGGATAVVIFLLAESLFGPAIAVWASFFWATDINAIAISRIGKEDSFLVFFFMLAALLYQKAKEAGAVDAGRAQPWYTASGVAFGLMMASKYMPYYYGLHVLFGEAAGPGTRPIRPRSKLRVHMWMAVAFVAANFAILLPANWLYMLGYVQGHSMIHTGYMYAGRIYTNVAQASPWGVPAWFYLSVLALKVPLVVLAAACAGLWPLVQRRRERGYVLIRVFLVFILLPYSLAAGKFVRYLHPFFVAFDMLAAVGVVWMLDGLARASWAPALRKAAAIAVIVLAVSGPAWAAFSSAPYYSLYQNAVGASLGEPGWLCPNDEFYDAGVRETVAEIAAMAGPRAVVASDAVGVVEEYLRRAGRGDMQSWSMSRDGLPMDGRETWVLAQEGHRYFENDGIIRQLELRGQPVRERRVGGGVAVRLYRFPVE